MKSLLIATHNPGKFKLFQKYFEKLPFNLHSLAEYNITYDVPETGTTFKDNALLKAKEYYRLAKITTLADDGGLMVDALNGEPGVYSARYAGPHATDKQKVEFLLNKLKDIPAHRRSAKFVSVLALVKKQDAIYFFDGIMHGTIAQCAKGTLQLGLPYKQIFIPEGYTKTLNELDDMQDFSYVSHRQKAIAKLMHYLT